MGVEVQQLDGFSGDNKTFPTQGDVLGMHYTGTLADGTKFDSSRDRDPSAAGAFTFTIGIGQVIKVHSSSLLHMRCYHSSVPGRRGGTESATDRTSRRRRSLMPSEESVVSCRSEGKKLSTTWQ